MYNFAAAAHRHQPRGREINTAGRTLTPILYGGAVTAIRPWPSSSRLPSRVWFQPSPIGVPDTLTQVDAALKQVYRDLNEQGVFFDGREALSVIPKAADLGGRNEPIVVHFSRTGGRSASFSNAQTIAAAKAKRSEGFLITGVDDCSVARVPGKTLDYARNNSQAWEMLLAMLAMEAAFGIPGVIAAPIYYAYVKNELSTRGLI